MHNTLLSTLLHVHVSTLLRHLQGDILLYIKYYPAGFMYPVGCALQCRVETCTRMSVDNSVVH